MSTVKIWSSATLLPVQLQLAPTGAASSLELLVLEAIQSGVDDAARLAAYFGIPSRLMIDVIGDLWRAQRVNVALGESVERITITGSGRKCVQESAEADYESAMRIPHVEHVLFDSLSGQFVSQNKTRTFLRDRGLLVPTQSDDPDFRRVPPHHLAEAVARNLRKRGDSEEHVGEHRVVSARLVPAVAEGSEEVRYVPLDVDVKRLGDGSLTFNLVESTWPVDVQRRTMERLERLATEAADSAFVRTLAANADVHLRQAPTLHNRITELTSSANNLATTAPGKRQSAHGKITGRFESFGHQLADLARRELSVRLVHGRSDHDRTIDSVIESARSQLIIALPWLHYQELKKHNDALEEAVTRGVGLTVLWGINRDDNTLDRDVLNLFNDLDRIARHAGAGGFVHLDQEQSSHIHAKVVAADDRAALITSRNLFSPSDLFEVGVLVEAPRPEPAPDGEQVLQRAPLLEEIATWAYNTTPNFGHASHVLRDPLMFGRRTDEPRWTPPARPFVDLTQLIDPDCPPEYLQLWQRGWLEAVAALEADIDRPAPVGYLVTDGLHQSLLSNALAQATRRVVVSSHGLSGRVLNGGLITQIRQCLDRGVNVTLYYGKAEKDEDKRALARLQDVAVGSSGSLEVTHRANLHAKVLIFDDEFVVGSYNYLSFDGAYGAGRRSQRAEMSIRVIDKTLAETLARLLSTTHFRGGAKTATITAPQRRATSATLAAQVVAALQDVESLDLARLAAQVPDVETYASLQHEFTTTGVSQSLARRFDAVLVAATANEPTQQAALQGLLRRCWQLDDLVVAHAIRDQIPDDSVRPSKALTAACAAIVTDPLGAEALVEGLTRDELATLDERVAVSILRMLSILTTGDSRRANSDLLDRLEDMPELARWHQSATDYVIVHGALPQGLDQLLSPPDDATEQRLWASIPPLVDRLERWKPRHLETKQTVDYLVEYPLGRLREIAATRDLDALATWVAANRGSATGGWLDDQIQKAGVRIRIVSKRRLTLLDVTGDLLIAARKIVASADPTRLPSDLDIDELKALARDACALVAALPDDVVEVAPARARLAKTFDPDGGQR